MASLTYECLGTFDRSFGYLVDWLDQRLLMSVCFSLVVCCVGGLLRCAALLSSQSLL